MPLPNWHSARLHDPGDFKEKPDWSSEGKFRNKLDGTIYGKIKVPGDVEVIWGQLKSQSGDEAAPQALRFPKDGWSTERAKKWLADNNVKFISFTPAGKEDSAGEIPEMKMFHARILQHKTKQSEDGLIIEGFASTPAVDRDDEIIAPSAFKTGIDAYMANPILLYMHDPRQPIGKVVSMSVDEQAGFWIKAMLSKAADVADIVTKIGEGILRAFSVGFRPISNEKEAGRTKWTEIEVWETSIVSIPSNREALFSIAKALKYGSDLMIPENAITSENLAGRFVTREEFDDMRTKLAAGNAGSAITATTKPDEHDKFTKTLADIEREIKEEKQAKEFADYLERMKGYSNGR